MCGEPVYLGGQSFSSWYAPDDPDSNEYGRAFRHAQASDDGVTYWRYDRKWGRGSGKAAA